MQDHTALIKKVEQLIVKHTDSEGLAKQMKIDHLVLQHFMNMNQFNLLKVILETISVDTYYQIKNRIMAFWDE